MKALNTIKFITESAVQFNVWLERIENADTYQKAVNEAHAAVGYIDCMTVYLNNMISEENNFFTGELGDTLDEWTANIYQKMVNKATETNQDHDTIWKLLCKRDEYKK